LSKKTNITLTSNPLPAYAEASAGRPSRARKKYWEISPYSNFPSTGGRELKGGGKKERNY
jgi:hypothetical protein